jgi:hypothetical protein
MEYWKKEELNGGRLEERLSPLPPPFYYSIIPTSHILILYL